MGAAAVDVIAQAASSSDSSLIAHSTVPGMVRSSLGGVGRNVAEAAHRTLVSLGDTTSDLKTLLVSPIGDDAFGALVRGETKRIGMRTDGFLSNSEDTQRRTPVCNMVLTGAGDLVGGVADFGALDILKASEARDSHFLTSWRTQISLRVHYKVLDLFHTYKPRVIALDGNISEDVAAQLVGYSRDNSVPGEALPQPREIQHYMLTPTSSLVRTHLQGKVDQNPTCYTSFSQSLFRFSFSSHYLFLAQHI